MKSPTYAMAEEDKEFINSYEARGIRLELDYLKPELKMKEYGIKHTIVVFGSARIVEKETAMKRLSTIQEMLQKKPNDRSLLHGLYVAERMVGKSIYYDDARKFGQLVGKSYWNKAIDFEFLKDDGVIAPQDVDIITFSDNAEEAWQFILSWYKKKGTPLFD